ncbi:LuxR C-terminal-related transcriptional regulator [Virgibacillus necropolis]|uniref:LuxR C-terminal-related transcriptional regulator n=1 Tax=Virgibacillus necropolis TaxID=163877 RepID=UPI00384CCA99
MVLNKKAIETGLSMDDMIKEVEADFFVGRKKEIELFKRHIGPDNQYEKVLFIYGTGGIGKTYLLSEFARISEQKQLLFIKMDSEDFLHTPSDFATYLLTLVELKNTVQSRNSNVLKNCLQTLTDIALKQRIIITIDSYEKMDDLDRWFQQVFIRHVSPNVLFVMAGRNPLKGEWEESPAWRKVTKQIELKEFNLTQTHTYLSHYDIGSDNLVKTMWHYTNGHPLTLSLAALTNKNENIDNSTKLLKEQMPQVLRNLTQRWLHEKEANEVHSLIEVAAVLHSFDQTSLSFVLGQKVTIIEFNKLTALSFIKSTRTGWAMHDLVRDAIRTELKHRNVEHFNTLSERCAAFYYRRTIATRSLYDIAQFFYHLDNEFIQSVLFKDTIDASIYFEPVAAHNIHEVIAFFEHKKNHLTKSDAEFYNRGSSNSFHFHASLQHNKKESELMQTEYIQKMGYDIARLLKNEAGKTIGLSVIVPINKNTLKHLSVEPVSRAYFEKLNDEQLKGYSVSDDRKAGYFIRMLDYTDPKDTSARSFSLYSLFPLLLSGGEIIVSTPLSFFQDLLKSFGFQEVPGTTHYDYGENYPSPTYLLDVSGPKLAVYLKQFTKSTYGVYENNQMKTITETFSFTDREEDIVKRIVDEKGNAAIAKELYIAEITVKKHISRILSKVGVKNRTQLIKRIMELI